MKRGFFFLAALPGSFTRAKKKSQLDPACAMREHQELSTAPGAPGFHSLLPYPCSFITRSQTPTLPRKKSVGRNEEWCKIRGLQGAGWECRQHTAITALCSAAIAVPLQKQLRGLDLFDHICSCAACNREQQSNCFGLGSDSEPAREQPLRSSHLDLCSAPLHRRAPRSCGSCS